MSDLLITNATLLDLEAGTLAAGSALKVTGGRISEVSAGRPLTAEPGTEVVDADGLTLMPGLIDAHVHATLTTLDLGALARRPATRIGIESKTVLEGMLQRA
jgi:imidazolonepropionase-like amidohydrolase